MNDRIEMFRAEVTTPHAQDLARIASAMIEVEELKVEESKRTRNLEAGNSV